MAMNCLSTSLIQEGWGQIVFSFSSEAIGCGQKISVTYRAAIPLLWKENFDGLAMTNAQGSRRGRRCSLILEGDRTMTRPVSTLLADALSLSEEERGELVARLLESLEPITEDDVEAAWDTEIRQRLDELDQGTVRAVPWAEAQRMIREEDDESGRS